jgi:hypothetical protein
LLATNKDLCNYMFDKMFRNMYDAQEKQQAILSKLTLSEAGTGFALESLEQLDDPLELLNRSTELRRMMSQQSGPTPHQINAQMGFNSVTAYQSKTKNEADMFIQSLTKVDGTYASKQAADAAQYQLQLDRKQKSMAINVNKQDPTFPNTLLQNGKGDRQTLREYASLIDKSHQGKAQQSELGNAVYQLSNVDTDRMQK